MLDDEETRKYLNELFVFYDKPIVLPKTDNCIQVENKYRNNYFLHHRNVEYAKTPNTNK